MPCAVLFASTTWQTIASGPLRVLDERLARAVVGRGPAGLTEFLADLGNTVVALPVLAVCVAHALFRRLRGDAVAAVLAMALVPVLIAPLKALTDRPGPLTAETGYFPSGHAATAMVAYGWSALLLAPAPRRWTMSVAALLTAATGVGLVLRGYHWPLDVIASWSLCGVLLLVSSGWRRWRPPPRASTPPAARGR
ncbi:phosphatase PAP2 family protein [Streptomyces sp. NPDC059176]|uniref:phosphatase PAP2 family protein n=1 Tax=unclassified Streptomyces TaxID=2593676 RepID=UPI003676D9A8